MKAIRTYGIAKILLGLFLVMTIIMMFIVYLNIENRFVYPFLFGYAAVAFLLLVSAPVIVVCNAKYFSWIEIKRRSIKFIKLFITLGVVSHLLLLIFAPTRINMLTESANAFGIAFGLSFFDVALFRKEKGNRNIENRI